MCTILQSLRQWGVITGTVVAPPDPIDPNNPTADETSAIEVYQVRCISAFMEISFRIADSTKSVLGTIDDPKTTWELLEKRFGAKQQGLQSVLLTKLQLSKWDGTGTIHAHHDYMVDLHTKLTDTGMAISDQTFYKYFTHSLPTSLNLFITLYEDPTYDVDILCDRFTKYEMQRKVAATRDSRADTTSDATLALYGQHSSSSKGKGKERKKRDLKDVTCYRCRRKGHYQAKCPDGEKNEEKRDEKRNEKRYNKRDEKSKPAKGSEETNKPKIPASGTLYTAVYEAQASVRHSGNTFYIDSGASHHLIPTRGDLHAYEKFTTPMEIAAADGGKIYAYGSGTLRVATTVNGLERQEDLQGVCYAPGIHA